MHRSINHKPIWCVAAQVLPHSGGTRHFAPGDNVYVLPSPAADTGIMKVIGIDRRTHRYLTVFMKADQLSNWHVVPIEHPSIIQELQDEWDDSEASRIRAEQLARQLSSFYN